MNAAELAGLLSEPERLRVVAALALGATTVAEVVARADLDLRTMTRALRRLETGGLVSTVDGLLVLRGDVIKEAARSAVPPQATGEPPTGDRAMDSVLRRFVIDGRLVSIPASHGKRRKILEHIVMAFEPGVRYPERDVNAMLPAWHPDYATLRRYLVDEQGRAGSSRMVRNTSTIASKRRATMPRR